MSKLIVNTIRSLGGTSADVMDIGQGQTWVSLNAERQAGVVYTNDTGRSILVNIAETTDAIGTFFINEVQMFTLNGTTVDSHLSILIPPNNTYRFTGTFIHWAELR